MALGLERGASKARGGRDREAGGGAGGRERAAVVMGAGVAGGRTRRGALDFTSGGAAVVAMEQTAQAIEQAGALATRVAGRGARRRARRGAAVRPTMSVSGAGQPGRGKQ